MNETGLSEKLDSLQVSRRLFVQNSSDAKGQDVRLEFVTFPAESHNLAGANVGGVNRGSSSSSERPFDHLSSDGGDRSTARSIASIAKAGNTATANAAAG